MKKIISLLDKYLKSKPMLYIGLKFLFWFTIMKNGVNILLETFPNLLQNYLNLISELSVWSLNAGLNLHYEMYILKSGVGIWNNDFLSVVVNETCGGIPVYTLYFTLIFAFITSFPKKLISSFLGLIILLIANNIRIIGIILVKEFSPVYFKFAHEILFVYLMYGLMLWLWYKVYKSNSEK